MKRHVFGFVLVIGLLGCSSKEEAGPDAKGAAIELETQAKAGDSAAQFNLGMMYYQGAESVEQDLGKAYAYLMAAAKKEEYKNMDPVKMALFDLKQTLSKRDQATAQKLADELVTP
jgi:TPR repeat protein